MTTDLEFIRSLALRLATIAHDPEAWEQYKVVETDNKGIVIDRTENNLSYYVRECEKKFSALYDADMEHDARMERTRQQLREIVEKAQNSQQQGQILIAMQIVEILNND